VRPPITRIVRPPPGFLHEAIEELEMLASFLVRQTDIIVPVWLPLGATHRQDRTGIKIRGSQCCLGVQDDFFSQYGLAELNCDLSTFPNGYPIRIFCLGNQGTSRDRSRWC
jgi:hypothetical protein